MGTQVRKKKTFYLVLYASVKLTFYHWHRCTSVIEKFTILLSGTSILFLMSIQWNSTWKTRLMTEHPCLKTTFPETFSLISMWIHPWPRTTPLLRPFLLIFRLVLKEGFHCITIWHRCTIFISTLLSWLSAKPHHSGQSVYYCYLVIGHRYTILINKFL